MKIADNKTKVIGGGAAIALITALTTMGPGMFKDWIAHRERMMAMRYSDAQQDHWKRCVDENKAVGGHMWKGDCLDHDGNIIEMEIR